MADQITLPDGNTRRELALERSQKVSRALHDAARKARLAVRKSSLTQPGIKRGNRGARAFVLLSALLVVVLPTLGATAYYGFIAADQFQVETQFAVHSGEPMVVDSLTALTGLPSITQAQDSIIVADYIRSRAIVDKIEPQLGLRKMYARPEVVVTDRLEADAPIEDLVRYWNDHIYIGIDSQSGIITARFRAFQREDSFRIASAVLAACEGLVNDLSRRSRQDAVVKAQEELARSESRLTQVREQFRALRDKERLLDPVKSADAFNRQLTELRSDRIKLENEIQVSSRSLSASSPQLQLLKVRLDAIAGQIDDIEKKLTVTGGGAGSLSTSFSVFDKARLDQEWAETYYKSIATVYERAKVENERQQVYLESFVRPTMPERAEFPRRMWNVFLIGLGATVAWCTIVVTRSLIQT